MAATRHLIIWRSICTQCPDHHFLINSYPLYPSSSMTPEHTLTITRTFNAPRERVWQAWTDPTQIAQWFGPEGFTTRVEKLDLRPGGSWHYVMIDQDGKEYPAVGTFTEVIPPEKLVTTDEFGDEDQSDGLKGIVVTVLFEEQGDTTLMTLHIVHRSAEDMEKHRKMGVLEGWGSSFNKMDKLLA